MPLTSACSTRGTVLRCNSTSHGIFFGPQFCSSASKKPLEEGFQRLVRGLNKKSTLLLGTDWVFTHLHPCCNGRPSSLSEEALLIVVRGPLHCSGTPSDCRGRPPGHCLKKWGFFWQKGISTACDRLRPRLLAAVGTPHNAKQAQTPRTIMGHTTPERCTSNSRSGYQPAVAPHKGHNNTGKRHQPVHAQPPVLQLHLHYFDPIRT